jgi:hypothetical protein
MRSNLLLVRLTKHILKPLLASYLANSAPIPSEAPVITAHEFSPYSLSILRGSIPAANLAVLLHRNSATLNAPYTRQTQHTTVTSTIPIN